VKVDFFKMCLYTLRLKDISAACRILLCCVNRRVCHVINCRVLCKRIGGVMFLGCIVLYSYNADSLYWYMKYSVLPFQFVKF
jgi:hypothetical protein